MRLKIQKFIRNVISFYLELSRILKLPIIFFKTLILLSVSTQVHNRRRSAIVSTLETTTRVTIC